MVESYIQYNSFMVKTKELYQFSNKIVKVLKSWNIKMLKYKIVKVQKC